MGGTHFRTEIVQLRALAVLSVLFFHLKVPGFQGGFVGVDVFFVISGYLITRNILRMAEAGRFSFGAFYLRRMRRIYPALIFTVLATYFAGAVWTAPLLFLDIAKECTHALLSIANIQYWREANQYFAAKSEDLALLHCWSLSLEEQFYLVWPALLLIGLRIKRVGALVLVTSIVSFVATALLGPRDSSAVFFLMPFRIFEFGVGALVLFLAQARAGAMRELSAVGGLVAIVTSVVLLRPETPRQELLVLLPCVGSAAVIWAGEQAMASKALRIPGVLGIGTISYSLYLCHWPIIFFSRFIFGNAAETAPAIIFMLSGMLLVATAMYCFVERRFQTSVLAPQRTWVGVAQYATLSLAIVVVTHWTFLAKGFAWRMPQAVLVQGRLDSPAGSDSVAWSLNQPPTIDLVGDSHAGMYAPGLLPLVESTAGNLEYAGEAGCPILLGVAIRGRRRADCLRVRDEVMEGLKDRALPIIFVQRWETYDDAYLDYDQTGSWSDQGGSFTKLEDALYRTLSALTKNRRVLLVGAQVPTGCEINRPRLLQGPLAHVPPEPCAPMAKERAEKAGAATNAMLANVEARFPGRVDLIRPVDWLCDAGCPVYNGHWLYWDPTHFTIAGSVFMIERAKAPFLKFILHGSTAASNDPVDN